MNDHLLATHLEVFYPCSNYTDILGLQLPQYIYCERNSKTPSNIDFII